MSVETVFTIIEMIGFLSQLTHCIAITLMTCNDRENMEKFTGDSFRDLTRIARINDLMWSELFVSNKDMLLGTMITPIGNSFYSFALSYGDMMVVTPISSIYSVITNISSR